MALVLSRSTRSLSCYTLHRQAYTAARVPSRAAGTETVLVHVSILPCRPATLSPLHGPWCRPSGPTRTSSRSSQPKAPKSSPCKMPLSMSGMVTESGIRTLISGTYYPTDHCPPVPASVQKPTLFPGEGISAQRGGWRDRQMDV